MVCSKCGNQFDGGFCPVCGTPSQQVTNQQASQYGQQAPQYGQQAPQYGQQAPQYGQQAPQYGQQAPQYGQQAPQYGQQIQYVALPPVRKINSTEAVKSFFKNYATFSGRATRSEFWLVLLFNYLVEFALTMAIGILGRYFGTREPVAMVFSLILILYSLAIVIPSISILVRRLHDIGKSGAYFFMSFIPLAGAIIIFVFEVTASVGDNEYGARKI